MGVFSRWDKPDLNPNPSYPSLSSKLEVRTGGDKSDNKSDSAQVRVVSKEVMSAGQVR